nr:MAG TPA: delta-sleep-inducing peptide [Caudoviricetes sp.]
MRDGKPPTDTNEGGRNMKGMPNAAETIERLAREAERLKIEVERLKAENAELKRKAEQAEAQ